VNRRALLGAALAGTTAAVTAGCGSSRDAPLRSVTIAAGTPGGVYHELANAFARQIRDRWHIPAEVLITNESIGSVRSVSEGKADIGFATVDICDLALQADEPFLGVMPIAALAGLYEDYLQIVVSDDSQIVRVSDLARHRVSLGTENSGTKFVAGRILLNGGVVEQDLTRYDLSTDAAAVQMQAGNLDAFFLLGGVPTPAVVELAGNMKVRLLSIPDEASQLRDTYRQSYLLRSIPAGMYGADREVSTIGVANLIVIHKDAPEDVAFRLTELLLASKEVLAKTHSQALRLDPRSAVSTFKIPLHEGALRYYRSAKPFLG
jgi:TRAP transporter TAXI family solute receptor